MLKYDVHVMTCLSKFRRSYQWYIFIHSVEWNSSSLLSNVVASNLRVSRCVIFLLSGNSKGYEVWGISTYIHKSRGKSTDYFNIEKRKIRLNHEPRDKLWDINDRTYGYLCCLCQEKNRQIYSKSGELFWVPFMITFLEINLILIIKTWPKALINKLIDILFW